MNFFIEPVSKFFFIISLLWVVIPAQAGIHVFQGLNAKKTVDLALRQA